MNVVLDTNVVVSAIFWRGEARRCLTLWAKRRFQIAISEEIFEEYCEVAARLARRVPEVNPKPWLDWIEGKAKVYEPALLGKQRSRDADNDPFLACALASGARIVVSNDEDLLALEKPFGIERLTPHQLLQRLK